jgi:hypothetical protein
MQKAFGLSRLGFAGIGGFIFAMPSPTMKKTKFGPELVDTDQWEEVTECDFVGFQFMPLQQISAPTPADNYIIAGPSVPESFWRCVVSWPYLARVALPLNLKCCEPIVTAENDEHKKTDG